MLLELELEMWGKDLEDISVHYIYQIYEPMRRVTSVAGKLRDNLRLLEWKSLSTISRCVCNCPIVRNDKSQTTIHWQTNKSIQHVERRRLRDY